MRLPVYLLMLLFVLPACQRPPMVMPLMFESGQVAGLGDTPDAWRTHEHTLFYATDRRFDPNEGDDGVYNHLRNDELSLGQLTIDLGEDNAWLLFNDAIQAKPGGAKPRPELAGIKRLGTMRWGPAGKDDQGDDTNSERPFIGRLDAALKASNGKTINIYIHGFNTSFEEAALTAAELSLYGGGLGPFVLYSWPSYDSLFEYSHDRDSVRYTTAHARRFVEMLANEIAAGRLNADRINLVAHSSGAEVAGSILRELGLMSHALTPAQREDRWKIGDVILIAPDISTGVARERILKEDLRGMYDEIVVYASRRDTALRWASRILYRATRIGSIRESDLNEADRFWLDQAGSITLVNIDGQPNGDPIGHSHHRFSAAALSDILLSLRSDLPPEQRGLMRSDGEIIWRFAEDYERYVTEAAAKVYGKAPGGSQEQQP
ncbi:MAG: alpha/beta hydrolase [Planctomycetota bacterium]